MFEAIEEELVLADDDVNILSETAADSSQRHVRRLQLERQRSTQFEADLTSPPGSHSMSPQHTQPLTPKGSHPATPSTPRERKLGLMKQISKQKSINEPPEKMDKGAAKDENTRLIQAEAAETGNVS